MALHMAFGPQGVGIHGSLGYFSSGFGTRINVIGIQDAEVNIF